MHKHTLWYPKRGSRGRPVCFQSHILTQCSLSPGNFERGARGRLVCLGVVYPLVNNPRGRLVRLHLVCPLVTSRGVPGEGLFVLNHTHTPVDAEGRVELGSIVGGGKEFRLVCLHLVCPMVTSRGVPGEGLFVLDCTHAQTHTLVPQKG